jgi:ssDNA-binding Zn-finger/Zn-ribbon topoisomerase 1
MGFIIEQECPQCGAPLDISEADRILTCPHCYVQSYMFSHGFFRYILPPKAADKEIIHIPYLRFRGTVFFCTGTTVDYKIIDITQAGVNLAGIPVSLGFRPQSLKARFARSDTNGRFIKFTLKAADILARAARLTSNGGSDDLLHRAFIGETVSIIYLPVYVENGRLYDAILNRPLSELLVTEEDIKSGIISETPETVSFIPMLCPECGADMKGERESALLLCNNCLKGWEVKEGRFAEIKVIFSARPSDETLFLPFWKITAKAKGIDIDSYGDFVRLTNQPFIIDKRRSLRPMSYISPAFKIRPKMFLNLARQLTIMQMAEYEPVDMIPSNGLHPVTLPLSEAIQALKIILAASAVMKKNIMPLLPQTGFEILDNSLIYLPFRKSRFDMINEETGISINRQSLEFGMTL